MIDSVITFDCNDSLPPPEVVEIDEVSPNARLGLALTV